MGRATTGFLGSTFGQKKQACEVKKLHHRWSMGNLGGIWTIGVPIQVGWSLNICTTFRRFFWITVPIRHRSSPQRSHAKLYPNEVSKVPGPSKRCKTNPMVATPLARGCWQFVFQLKSFIVHPLLGAHIYTNKGLPQCSLATASSAAYLAKFSKWSGESNLKDRWAVQKHKGIWSVNM